MRSHQRTRELSHSFQLHSQPYFPIQEKRHPTVWANLLHISLDKPTTDTAKYWELLCYKWSLGVSSWNSGSLIITNYTRKKIFFNCKNYLQRTLHNFFVFSESVGQDTKLTHGLSTILFCNIVVTRHADSLVIPLPNNLPFNIVSNSATPLRCKLCQRSMYRKKFCCSFSISRGWSSVEWEQNRIPVMNNA